MNSKNNSRKNSTEENSPKGEETSVFTRHFFFPGLGISVRASSFAEAQEIAGVTSTKEKSAEAVA